MTKLQQLLNSSRRSKARRINKALQGYVDAVIGKGKSVGASVRKNPGGSVTITPIRKRRNVEMGFYRNGKFHPIRASDDYEESLVGTHPVKSRSRKKKAKTKARRR